jgi:ketosteroid isomerase-like protein
MSEENMEVARRFSEAFERSSRAYWKNPRSLVDALEAGDLDPEGTHLLSYLHPQVEWKTAFSLEGETHRGHLDFLKVCDEFLDATEDYSVTVREVTDLGTDRVLVVSDLAFKGKGTGIEVNGVSCALITVRGGLIVRIDEFSNRNDALEALRRPGGLGTAS